MSDDRSEENKEESPLEQLDRHAFGLDNLTQERSPEQEFEIVRPPDNPREQSPTSARRQLDFEEEPASETMAGQGQGGATGAVTPAGQGQGGQGQGGQVKAGKPKDKAKAVKVEAIQEVEVVVQELELANHNSRPSR